MLKPNEVRNVANQIVKLITKVNPKIEWIKYEINLKDYERIVSCNMGKITDYTLLSLIDSLIPLLDLLEPDGKKIEGGSSRKYDVYEFSQVKVLVERFV